MGKIIRQHNTIIAHNTLIEAPDNIPAIERTLVYTVYAQLKDSDPVDKIYFVSIQKLQKKLSELGWKIDIDQIQEATANLLTRTYYIIDADGYAVYISLFGSVTYTDNSDIIEIGLSTMIRPYLFYLKEGDFTKFALDISLSLKARYSQLIYQMLCQHLKDGVLHLTIEKLKRRLFSIDPKDSLKEVEEYKAWSSFSKYVLEPSQKEINTYTDLYFTYTPQKTGRKYTDITFHINTKKEIKY